MTVTSEPGDSTMIRISWSTKEALLAMRKKEGNKNEAIGDVVKRNILEIRTLQNEKSALLKQVQNFQPAPGSLMPTNEIPKSNIIKIDLLNA
jgi:hypothetical protein